jgi:membrane AbrB-like protein
MKRAFDVRSLTGLATALVIAAAGGFAADALGIPAGWFAGAMIGVSIAAVSGVKVYMPPRLIEASTMMIGIMLGAGVTPEVVAGIAEWPVSLAMLAVSVVVCQVCTQNFLTRFGGWDRPTAYFAALPGAMVYCLVAAAETSADLRRVAINQMVRIFFLIALLPTIVTVLEAPGAPPARLLATPVEILLLLGTGVPCALLFKKLRIPVGLMTGGLLASAILHGSGTVHGSFPEPVLIAAFIVLGASVGVRFLGTTTRYLAENAVTTVGAFIVGIVVSGFFAWLVTLLVDVRLDQLFVAFAPGGVDAMIAIALAMHMDSAFVAAHQIFRLMGVIMFGPLGARLTLAKKPKAQAGG